MERKGIFDRIIGGLAYLGGILLGCAVIIKFCDIILRYFFNKPLTWDIEITEYILFAVAFFGAAWLLREGGHVRIDVLDNFLSEKGKTYLHLVHSAVGAFVSMVLCLMSFVAAAYSYRDGLTVVKIYTIGKYYFLFIISLGFFLLLAEFLRQFARDVRKVRNKSTEEGAE